MDIATENAVIKAVKNFTPEQLETCGRDAEWANKRWSNETLAKHLEKELPYCSAEALVLAMEQSDAFQIAIHEMVSAAVRNQHAIDMLTYSATFDEVA